MEGVSHFLQHRRCRQALKPARRCKQAAIFALENKDYYSLLLFSIRNSSQKKYKLEEKHLWAVKTNFVAL
jgi:hypothetical protein